MYYSVLSVLSTQLKLQHYLLQFINNSSMHTFKQGHESKNMTNIIFEYKVEKYTEAKFIQNISKN